MRLRGLRKPLCNGRLHTAPQLFGITFPLCWRCSTIAASVCAMQIILGATFAMHWGYGILGASMVLLGAFDGYKSYFTRRGTTNFNRAIFGLITGVGLFLVAISLPHFSF
ncbi:hypothetical protein DL239_02535 [Sedimentitalea sp. CY04]|uniref:DUF2085 domain-containing protein n=1 Tax=Parasedimentitalea denitrificans TaxID=2211118 RepID=A0ABX0W2S6_9RHOB|nr:hypothetical protein [Sedimentitalea sp. CY04]